MDAIVTDDPLNTVKFVPQHARHAIEDPIAVDMIGHAGPEHRAGHLVPTPLLTERLSEWKEVTWIRLSSIVIASRLVG